MPLELEIPYNWRPRDYQLPAWLSFERGCKRFDLCWHRRAGKDLFAINVCAVAMMRRPGIYWHVLPTYAQGRKIVWEGKTRDGRDFLSHFPDQLILRRRHDEMSLWLAGGSLYQVIGADDPDRLVGANPFGVIFSEWSLMSSVVWELVMPILAENGGWAIFIYTPRGHNHAHYQHFKVRDDPNWFAQLLTRDDTNAVSLQAIQEARDAGMPEEMIQQEFYCSFEAPLQGSYYGEQMTRMREEGRLGTVPWEPTKPVTTAWDLGIGDATAIWFIQEIGEEPRAVDYYESSGVGLAHYHKILREKPYAYDEHLVPHDAAVRELGTGKSRIETAALMGLRMRVVPKLSLDDGIEATRQLLTRLFIDSKKCSRGARGLQEYTKEDTGLRDPDGRPIFRDKPRHDWTSHPADALRTYAVGRRRRMKPRAKLAPDLAIV